MVTALKRMTLAGTEIGPGEVVPDPLWSGVRERTRRALVDGRFVTFAARPTPPDATIAPNAVPESQQRGRRSRRPEE